MATWHEITRDPEYQELTPEAKSLVKKGFFERVIAADPEYQTFTEDTQKAIFDDFWQTPDDTGQGYVTSMLGAAGRGLGEMVPGAIEGVGALTGSEGLREFGQDVRGGLEAISPVNPIYAESVPVKLAGVGGQVGSMLATAGAGGLAGKALGGVGAATTGMRAAPLASAFLQGSAEGAREAERYGMTGPEAYLRTLAGGATEAGTELLPFGMAAETALAKRLLTGAPRTGTFLGAVGSEAGEEGLGQIASNIATKALAPAGVETPDITEGALEAAAYGAAGGAMIGGVNALISTPPERQTQIQKDRQAEFGDIPKDTVPDQTNEEKIAAMKAGGTTVVDPDGKTAVIPPAVVAKEPPSMISPEIAIAQNAIAATQNVPFTDITGQTATNIVQENARIASQLAVQSQQAAEEAGAEVTPSPAMEMPSPPQGVDMALAPLSPIINEAPLSEGAERNRAIIAEASAGTPVQAASIESIELPTDSSDAIKGIVKRHDSLFKNLRNAGVDVRLSRPSEAAETKGVFWVNETDEGKLELVLDEKNAEKTEAVGLTDQAIFHETVHAAQALFDRDNQFLSTQADKVFDPNSAEFDQELDSFMANEVPSWSKIRGTRNAKYEAVRALLEAKHLNKTSRSFRPGMPFVRYLSQFIEWAKANVFSFGTAKNKKFSLYVTKIDRLLNSILSAAPIQPQPVETQEDAVQEQIPDEGVLRQERPEMELQGVDEGNVQPEEVAREGEVEAQEEVAAQPPAAEVKEMGVPVERDATKPEQMNKFLSDLRFYGTAKIGGDQYTIKQASDDSFYIEKTTGGQRSVVASGFSDIEGAQQGAAELVSPTPEKTSATGQPTPAIEEALPERGASIETIASGGGMSIEEARQFLARRTDSGEPLIFGRPFSEISGMQQQERPRVLRSADKLRAVKQIVGDINKFKIPVSQEVLDTYGITLPEGYVKQGDLYVFQPSLEQSGLGAGVATERETDEQRFQRIKALKPSQRSDDDIAFANEFSKRQKELKPQAGESTRKAFLANHTASIGGRLRKALDQGMNFRGLKGTVGSWVENLYNEGWRMALDARGNRQFTNGTEALGSSGLGKVGMNYADFLSSQPQTTAAEKQTPVPLRGGTGAAGVASSSLGGGRSPELTQVSTETETTSSEKLDPKLIEAERKQAKEEEAAVKQQEKLDQDTKSSLNSVVGPQKKDPVVGTVTKADVETAREALTNSGEIPNAYLTNVYESREAFLADKANERLFPASYARLQTEKNIEGLYENGQTLIFAKQIQVSNLDRGLAKMLGVSDEQAAARRVIAHENGHKAISLFTMAEKRELRGYLMRAYSDEQVENLVKTYTEYADWRTNPESRLEALEELLMRDFERMEKIPTGGVWDDIVQFLKRVWRRLTGQKGEPKLKELKDVVRLMRNAMKRPAVPLGSYTLKDGGQVKLSMGRPEFVSDSEAAFSAGNEAARSTLYSERDMDIREAIRRAYEAIPKTNSVAVPIGELFAKTEELMPGVTQDEFSNVLQDLFEDNGAVLQEGESDFFVTTPEGRRAGFVVVMPSNSISVPLALRSMAMSGPSGQPINQQKYDEALAAISDFLAGKQTVQFPGKLTLSSSSGVGLRAGDSGLTQGVGEAARTAGGGTGAGIARGQPSDAQAQGAAQQGFGPYSVRNLVGEASRIGVADVRIDPESQHGAYTAVFESGEIYIVINPARMANRIAANDGDVQYAIGSILNEELIHAADMAILRDQWLNSGSKLTLTEFVKEEDVKTVREMIQVAKSSNNPLEATRILFDAITSSINLYAGNDVTSLDSVEAFLNAASHDEISSVMGEFVRQMIQTGMYQTVSEKAFFRKFIEKVKVLARKIADVFAPAKEGQYGKLIQERLNGIEELLTYASSNTGAKASKIKADDAASTRLKDDIAAIENGSIKADFGGVQFTDFPASERTVKPKEFYTDAAIRFVNDLQDKRNSIEDIAFSIQSPDFLEAIGIENNLSAQDALTIEVRNRVNNELRREKRPDRKKRLDKMNKRLSGYWQGTGSKAGANLGIRKHLINDPRYRWMFIKDLADKSIMDAVENVARANMDVQQLEDGRVAPQEFTDKANAAGGQATDQAAQAIADNIESSVEDDEDAALIREGEETLDKKTKSLWDRAKMLIMRLAMYARADKADIKTGSRASLSKEQRDELNAILRMPKAERDKARAKDEAELKAVLKALLGEEVDAKTPEQKKIRGKRIKGIQTLEKRVKKGKPVDVEIEGEPESSEEQVSKAEKTAQSILKGLSERYSDPLIIKEKKPNVDAMRELYKERVKQGIGPNQMTEESFVNKAVELGADEKTAGILWKAAELEIDARESMRQDKILQRKAAVGARADAQAHRIIFAKERLKRQSGFSGIESNANKDTIIKAFQEQVKTPVSIEDFIARLRPLNVSETVAKRLFTAAEREKADLEAMEAFRMLEGPDALKNILREIERMRRGEEIPLRTPIPWRQLLSQKAKTVEEYRQRIFDAISSNEAFRNLPDDKKARMADLFSEAWESKRKDILDRMLTNLINQEEAAKRISKEGAKALREQRMKLVEDINLGILDAEEVMKRLAEKFGIKTEFTEQERQKIDSLIETIQDETLNRVKRNKAAYELLKTLSGNVKIPIVKMLADYWVASVLSGMNTATSIALAVGNGAFELLSGVYRVLTAGVMNPKDVPAEITASFKAMAAFLKAFKREGRLAWQYLVTGDREFLDPSMNDVLNDLNYESIGRSTALAEKMAESDKIAQKVMGVWMRSVSRLLTALDSFNAGVTKGGSLFIVARQLGLNPEGIAKVEEAMNLQNYKDIIIQRDFAGIPPKTQREKAILDSWAKDEMMAELDKYGKFSENANFYGQQGAMTLEPSGLGGFIYRSIKSLTGSATTGADKFLAESQRKWKQADNANKAFQALQLGLAYFLQFGAYNSANLAGLRFARFAGNKFNQGLSFLPGIGMLRLYESRLDKTHIDAEEAFTDMILRNQLAGFIISLGGVAILKAISDEPDDEKRGWFFNGSWANLTPEKKQQKLAAGQKEFTFGFGDKVFSYQNWPISSALAAIGGLSDLIRFSPEKWKEKGPIGVLTSAATSGVFSATEIPALSGFQTLFGNNLSSKDPNEKRLDRFANVMAGWGGGFVPRILKDFDYLAEPELRKYETLWERTASHIPIYRRYVGDEYYDILGKQIEKKVYPGSREFMEKPSEPEYQILGKLNSRGIWLTPANAEYRMVGKGRNRRRLTQEEADAYSLETGKGYRQMLLRYGQRALQMPTERARAFLQDKADEVRDRALKKVYRGYTK